MKTIKANFAKALAPQLKAAWEQNECLIGLTPEHMAFLEWLQIAFKQPVETWQAIEQAH